MKQYLRRFPYLCLALCMLCVMPIFAKSLQVYTGSKIGTYHNLAKDMEQALRYSETDVRVMESNGSLDNIQQIQTSEAPAVGIVQSDVLGFLKRSSSERYSTLSNQIRMVLPLYKEEVHIIANKSIRSIYDLHGKRVVVGPKGSGSWLTAMNMFSMLDIKPSELRRKPPEEGVIEVLKHTSDAMIYVAGKPVRLFRNVEQLEKNDKFASMLDNVHFVPIQADALLREYAPSVITASDYNYVSVDVPTIAVTAMLISHDDDFANRDPDTCLVMEYFANNLRAEYASMRQDGHPKWQEVDFDAELGSWVQDPCAANVNVVHDLEQELLGVISAAP